MDLDTIYDAVLDGDAKGAAAAVEAALAAGESPQAILNDACIPAMAEVGALFEEGEKFVPEMLISARAMAAAMTILRPLLVAAGVKNVGKVVLGTVHGDLHDIGKNLVGMMLEGAGFEVIDLGTDVPPQKFVAAVQEHRPDILGMSALLTTTTKSMPLTLAARAEAGVRDQVKVIIGGAPITDDFAKKIGADGFAADAGSAAREARALMGLT
ncbi:MAG TPA: corrinoid protein [Anaerolineae bacterium]|nr:corrinoid protein [Anaerolineae bacterium]